MAIPKDFKRYYAGKRGDAQNRNIPFEMTIEECWDLWQHKWNDNDSQTTGYRKWCLARYNDTGVYSKENCRIATHSENSKERWQTNKNFKPGKGDPNFAKYSKQNRRLAVNGVEYSSVGEAGREFGLHKTTVANRCVSKNFPDWQYIDKKVWPRFN
jgi:hypothetical protein